MKKQWTTIAAIVLIILVALLAMINMGPVPVHLGFADFEWPLIMVILGSLLMGALIATLISTSSLYTSRKEKRESHKRIEDLERSQSVRANEVKEEYQNKIEALETDKSKLKMQIKELEREVQNRRASSLASDIPESPDSFNY